MLEQITEQQAIAPKVDKPASMSGQTGVISSNGNKDRLVAIYDLAINQGQEPGSPHLPEVHSCNSEPSSDGGSTYGSTISRLSTISQLSDGGEFSTPHGSADDLASLDSRGLTPSPQPGKKIAQPSPLQYGSTDLREQPAVPPSTELPPPPLSSSPESGDDSNIEALLRECTNRLTASNIAHPQPAKINPLTQSRDSTTDLPPGAASSDAPTDLLIAADRKNQSNAESVGVLEPVESQAAAPASAAQNSAQPSLNNLAIDIDQAPNKVSWAGIGRSTIAWINYILTGFDVRDDSLENRVYRLQEKLIAHEIEQIKPQKEHEIEIKLQAYGDNQNEQRNFLLYKILKKENALCIIKLQEQEKQRALDETTSEKQNYDTAKAQLVNELNILYAQIQLEEKPETTQLNKIDSSGITRDELEKLYNNLLRRGKLQPVSPLLTAIAAAKEKYENSKTELINKLNNIHEGQVIKIGNAKNTSQNLNELYEKLLNLFDPAVASNYQEEIDKLLDSLDDEYDATRKTIIRRHYNENKEADRKKEQIIAANKADQANRDQAIKLFDEELELNEARYNEELKLLDEELARKKERYRDLLRLLEMNAEDLKKNYAQHLANEEKATIKRKIRNELQLDSLSLDEQYAKLNDEVDKKNANLSFTKKNVLWGITQATTTVVAASSGTVTAVACAAITIFTFHVSLPFLLLIGWAGYRVNFSIYQESIKNTLNSFFVNGLFHDPTYPNDLTKKVGPIKKTLMILATAVAGGAGVSIAAITFTSVSSCVVHLLLFFGAASIAAMPPVLIPIAGVVAAISLIAITALMFNTISNIIKNDNNSINRFCRKLYRKGFEKCFDDAVADMKFFFQHLTAKDVLHGVVTTLFIVAGIAIATLATVATISSWHSSLINFLETTAGIRDIVTNGTANIIALVACYCLTPVARFPVVLDKAAITFGLIAYAICNPVETYNKCAKKLHAFKEQAKAECIDAPSTALFIGKTVLVSACYIVAVTTIVGFIALNAIGNGALADMGGKILSSICGWFEVTLPKIGQNIASFASATTVSAAFAIVATQDTYGRPIESHDIEMKKLSANNGVAEGNNVLNNEKNNSNLVVKDNTDATRSKQAQQRLDEKALPEEESFGSQRAKQNADAATSLISGTHSNKYTGVDTCLSPGIANALATMSCGMWTSPYDRNPTPTTHSTASIDNTSKYSVLNPG